MRCPPHENAKGPAETLCFGRPDIVAMILETTAYRPLNFTS